MISSKNGFFKKFVSVFLTMIYILLSMNLNQISVAAAESGIKINGETVDITSMTSAVSFEYGVKLTDVITGGEDDIFMLSSDGENYTDISDSTKVTPGSYYLGYRNSEDEYYSSIKAINITEAVITAPGNISFTGAVISFVVPGTSEGYTVDEGAISGYTVNVISGDSTVYTTTTTSTSLDISDELLELKEGSYFVTLTAVIDSSYSSKYASANTSEKTGPVYVVKVQEEATEDTTVPDTVSYLIPGNSSHNSINLSATCNETTARIAGFNAEGFTVSELNKTAGTAKATIKDDYSGDISVVITPITEDGTAPTGVTISADGTAFTGKATDDETGICKYAFSTASDASDLTDADWTTVTSPKTGESEFEYTPTAAGLYYFYAQDQGGNIVRSSTAEYATKVVYNNYYDVTLVYDYTKYHTGSSFTFAVPKRGEFTLDGWYKDEALTDKITSVASADLGTTVTVYAKWTRNEVTFKTEPSYTKRAYNGENVVLTAELNNSDGQITWQWYKDGEAIEGATKSSYTVGKDAGNYGTYTVQATVTADKESTDKVRTGTSTAVTVVIDKSAITLTPKAASKTYGEADPVFSLETTGSIAAGESLTGFTVSRTAGEDVGTYTMSVAGDTTKYKNYSISFATADFTINAKSISGLSYSGIDSDGYTYNGSEIKPEITIKDGNNTLTKSTDYTVEYSDNVNQGEATVTITGVNNYTETKVLNFDINKADFTTTVSRADYLYGGTKSTIVLGSNVSGGEVTYYYREKGNGTYTTTEPTDAGTYEFYAVIAATTNYESIKTPVAEYTIKQRKITIKSYSQTWTYDGNAHSNATTPIISGDGFAGSDDFKSIEVTGIITDYGEVANTIEYKLAVKNENNYLITKDEGTLKVEKASLVAPKVMSWDSDNIGTATWVSVIRTGLDVIYDVELYRYDGASYTKVTEATNLTGNSYDFSSAIKTDAKNNGVAAYVFRVKSKVSSASTATNVNKNNYYDSDFSDYSAKTYTSKFTLNIPDSIKSATIAGKSSAILISGESVALSATVAEGYEARGDVWSVSAGFSSAVTFGDAGKFSTTLTLNSGYKYASEIEIALDAKDQYPVVDSFTAITADNKTVKLDIEISDTISVKKWLITTRSDIDEVSDTDDWNVIESDTLKTAEEYINVTTKGTYYAYVVDNEGNLTKASTQITLYRIMFNGGTGAVGSMDGLLKIQNVDLQLPNNGFTKTGYGFKNWLGGKGDLYENQGIYSFNADTTLEAQWSDEKFTYTVNYYLMDTSGNYQLDKTGEYTSLYGVTITPSTAEIAREYTGTVISNPEDSIVVTENGLVLNIYYARNKYKITYTYRKPAALLDTVIEQEYYYEETIGEEAAKPSQNGYTFIGWEYEGYGALPETMPNSNITATGSFEANPTTYTVNYYTKNLTGDDYTLAGYSTVNAINGSTIEFDCEDAMARTGYETPTVIITNGAAAGASPDTSKFSTKASGTVNVDSPLYVNYYYERSEYTLNLVVKSGADTKYTYSWTLKYEETIDPTYYETYDQDNWYPTADQDGKKLSPYINWSTGETPLKMPSGDVTVKRQYYYGLYDSGYTIEFYFETFDPDTGDHTGYRKAYSTFYSCSGGSVRTLGVSGTYWTFDEFKNYIANYDYYEFNSTPEDGNENILSVTTETGDYSKVLRAYFDRKTVSFDINYVYYGENNSTSTIATETVSGKWGSFYNLDSFKYITDYPNCAVTYSGYYYMTYSDGDDDTTLTSVSSNSPSYTYWYEGCYEHHWPTHIFKGSEIEGYDNRMVFGQTGNSMTVYYSELNPNIMYNINLGVYQNLTKDTKTNVDSAISYENNTYTLKIASEVYFYKDYTLTEGTTYDSYPVSKYLSSNGFKYVYSTDSSNLKDGYDVITIDGLSYIRDEANKIIYIADTSNQYYQGNWVSYSVSSDSSNKTHIHYAQASKHLTEYLAAHSDATDTDNYDDNYKGAYVYGYSSSWIMRSNTSANVSFQYKNIYQVYYTVEGKQCPTSKTSTSYHRASEGEVITVGCDHSIFENRLKQGYEIVWYKNTLWEQKGRVSGSYTINSDVTFYGRYEKAVFNCHKYVYYELANNITYDDTEINYVTEDCAEDLVTAGTLTKTTESKDIEFKDEYFTSTKQVTTTNYYLDGSLVMIDIEYPVLATSDVDFKTAKEGYWKAYTDYKLEGFHYDDTNTENIFVSYCQSEPANLKVYYARDEYTFYLDKDNSKVNNIESTVYPYEHVVTLIEPEKEGYEFAGWKYEYPDEDGNYAEYDSFTTSTDAEGNTTFKMPENDVKVTALWTPGNFDTEIIHYFQKSDKSYDVEMLTTVRAIGDGDQKTSCTVNYNNTDYSGYLYKDESGNRIAASIVIGTYTYYFAFEETGDVKVEEADIFAIVSSNNFETEAKLNIKDYGISGLSIFTYDYSSYKYDTEVDKLGITSTFNAYVGMSLEYYYTRKSDIEFTVSGFSTAEGESIGATLKGAGTYSYGETVKLIATPETGYSFVGWAKVSDVISDGKLIDGYASKLLSTDSTYSIKARASEEYVAVTKPDEVETPSFSYNGVSSLVYGYDASNDNYIAISADMTGLNEATYIVGYQWYKDGTKITGATSASYIIPTGLKAGGHVYKCIVTVGRRDNNQTIEVNAGDHTLTVSKSGMTVKTTDYSGVYDGATHGIQVSVSAPSSSSDYEIYYSNTELNESNYSTAGSTSASDYNAIKDVAVDADENVIPTVVYYYIKSNNSNYNDASGSGKVTLTPKTLLIKSQAVDGVGAYWKVYDGDTNVTGSIYDTSTEKGRLSQGGFFQLEGVASGDAVILDFDAELDSAHKDTITSVTMSNIKVWLKNSVAQDHNYVISTDLDVTVPAEITPFTLENVWDSNTSYEYDGSTHVPSISLTNSSDIPACDNGKFTISVTGEQKNVGTYSANAVINLNSGVTGTYTSDYKFSSDTQAFTITQKSVTVKPVTETVTYDGTSHTLDTINVTGVLTGQTYTVEKGTAYKNAGTYSIKGKDLVVSDAEGKDITYNYSITYEEESLVIEKRKVKVTGITAENKAYDGNTTATLKFESAELSNVLTDDAANLAIDTGKISGAFDTALVGNDKVVTLTVASDALTGTAAADYVIDVDNSEKTTKANITGAEIVVTPVDKTVTYGNTVNFEVTFTGGEAADKEAITTALKNSSDISYLVKAEGEESASAYAVTKNAGTYEISLDLSGIASDTTVSNYTFTAKTGTLTVNKKSISVAENSAYTKVYDGNTTSAITSANYKFTGVVNSDTVTLKSYDEVYNSKDVATATKVKITNAVIDDTSAKNYNLTNSAFDITATITAAPLTVTAKDTKVSYGDAIPTYEESYSGFIGTEDKTALTGSVAFACDYAQNATNGKVGTYKITPSGYGTTNGNYSISYADGTLTVDKAVITVTGTTTDADDKIIYKVDEIPGVEVSTSGFKYDETIAVATGSATASYATTPTKTSEAGDYTINVTGNYAADNYSFEYVAGKLTIEKHELTISGITVNGKEYDGTNSVKSSDINSSAVTYGGILEDDKTSAGLVNITAAYTDTEGNAGTSKEVKLTYELNEYLSKRYSIKSDSEKTTTADITKKAATVTADNKSIAYGSTVPAYSHTVTGLVTVNGTAKSDITGTAAYTCSYTNTTDVGSYDIEVANLTSNNYDLSYVKGTLTVTPATLATPSPKFSTENVGRVEWTAVSAIGSVSVANYKVELFKDAGTTAIYSTTTTDTHIDLLDTIKTNGVGKYYVKVTAIASTTNNAGNKNVKDSAAGTSDNKYAVNVTFAFADNTATLAAKTGGTITIGGTSEATMLVVAGEKDIALNATVANETGYLLDSCSSTNSSITVKNSALSGNTYTGKFDLAADLAASTAITINLSLKARPATISATVAVTANDGASYGYTSAKAPVFAATVDVGEGDNITKDNYTYTYKWSYKKGKSGSLVAMDSTTSTATAPTGLSKYAKYYAVCEITATRKDNNQSTTKTINDTLFSITAAQYSTSVVITGWKYGDVRSVPSLTAHSNTENPVVTYKFSRSASGPWTDWTDTAAPSDIGTWYVYANLQATENFDEYDTAKTSFEITANKLATPTGLTSLNSTDKAPYGTASWTAVNPPQENNGTNSLSTIGVKYKVTLYYHGANESVSDAVVKKSYDTTDATSLDLVNEIKEPGFYAYKVQAIAESSNSYKNCEDSDVSEYSEWLNVGCDITVTDDGTDVTTDSYERVYNAKNIVLRADADNGTYVWYKNGVVLAGETAQTLTLTHASEGYYSCKVTISGSSYDTTYKYIKISERPITITSASAKKNYDGTALTANSFTLKDGTTTFDESTTSVVDTITGDTVYVTITGTITDMGTEANTISSVTVKKESTDISSDYTVTKDAGTLEISARTIVGNVTIGDVSDVTYDGTTHTPEPIVKDGSTTLVKDTDYEYSYKNNTNAGTATITIKGIGNYTGEVTKTFTINKKPVTVTTHSKEKVYGTADPTLTYEVGEGLVTGETLNLTVSRVAGENCGEYAITTAETAAGNANYSVTIDNSTSVLKITKASQTAPSLTAVNETIEGKADGKITGLTTAMEYRVKGEESFTTVTGNENFAVGTYEVRYAGDTNHYASSITEVSIEKGRKLTVTLPDAADRTGYTITTTKSELVWHDSYTITLTFDTGYGEGTDFAIKVNGVKVPATLTDGKRVYTVTNAEADQVVTVEGVIDIVKPYGTIQVKSKAWSELTGSLLYNIFFKSTQTVTITADDDESGLDKIEYYISDELLNDSALSEITSWNTYTTGVDVAPVKDRVVYGKLTDKQGNVTYISTNVITSYKDSEADTSEVEYNLLSDTDATAKVVLNGNQIATVKNGDATLVKGTDYTVSDNVITFKNAYLEKQAVGDYTITVYYMPLGHLYVEDVDNDSPLNTTITLKIEKPVPRIVNISDQSKEYDGKVVEDPDYKLIGTAGTITIEYKKADADDTTYTEEKPKDAGEYIVRIQSSGDATYGGAEGKHTFTITKKEITAEYSVASKVYDKVAETTVEASLDTEITGESITVLGITGTYTDTNIGTRTITVSTANAQLVAGENTDLDNYNVILPETTKGIITAKPITVTVDDSSKYSRDTDPEFTYTAKGLVGEDTLSDITITRESGEEAGTYKLSATAKAGSNNNYNITFVNGEFIIKESGELGFVTITIISDSDEEYIATMEYGDTEIQKKEGLVSGDTFTFLNLPDAEYNLVIKSSNNVVTEMITIENHEAVNKTIRIIGNKNSKVVINDEDVPKVAVSGLQELFDTKTYTDDAEAVEAFENGGKVKIQLEVSETNDSTSINLIKTAAKKNNKSVASIFDLDIYMYITYNNNTTVKHITETDKLVLVAVPVDESVLQKKGIQVERNHNGDVSFLPLVDENITPEDEGFWYSDNYVYIWADKYSTYAIVYDAETTQTDNEDVKTGHISSVFMYIILMGAAIISAAPMTVRKKKEYK